MTKKHPADTAAPAPGRGGASSPPPADVARDLRRLLRGDVEFDDISRQLYATDAGLNQVTPLGVVSPRDTEDVVHLVEYAAEQGLPLIGRGMGSGLAGGAVGAGIQVDFTRYMNRVLEIAPDGSWARVQPGLVMANLNQEAAKHGAFFAPDPSSENYCSLGGMIGTNSSGARTVAYGGTKDHVLALETVLADGSIFRRAPLGRDRRRNGALLGRRHARRPGLRASPARTAGKRRGDRRRHAPGGKELLGLPAGDDLRGRRRRQRAGAYGGHRRPGRRCATAPGRLVHLQKLFVGAEGTLGLVTEATLNLVPLPRRRGIAMAYFPSVFASGEAVPGILALGPTAVEIMDSRFLALVRKHDSRVDAMLPERTDTALLIEFEGADDAEVDEKFAALGRHLAGTGALKMVRAPTAEEADRLWTVRKSAVALALRMPGPRRALPFIEDVTVHPDEVPGYVDFLQKLFDREKVDAVMYGHVGDGNIHTRPLLDPKDPGGITFSRPHTSPGSRAGFPGHQPERVVMGTRPDGPDDLLGLGGGEDELEVLRRLLDDLQQRVEACRRDHVGLVDDVDLVPAAGGPEEGLLPQLTRVVHTTVRSGVDLDDVDEPGPLRARSRQDWHSPHGVGVGPCSQFRQRARIRALVVFRSRADR